MRRPIAMVPLLLLAFGAATARADVRETVVPGLYGTVATAAEPSSGALWSLREDPVRLTRYDGRLRTFAIPQATGAPRALAAARDAVYLTAGDELLRLRPSTGSVRRWKLGFDVPQALTAAEDGTLWVLHHDGRTGRIDGAGRLRWFAPPGGGKRLAQAPLVEGPGGRMWYRTSGRGTYVTVDRAGRSRVVRLPLTGTGSLLARDGERMLVSTGLRRLVAYRGTRIVAQRRGPNLQTLVSGADGRRYGLTSAGTLMRVSDRLVTTPVAENVGWSHQLFRGPRGRLWTVARDGLARFVPRATPGLAQSLGCALPDRALRTVREGSRSVLTRDRQVFDTSHLTWFGCATTQQRPVVLMRGTQDQRGGTYVSRWRIAGTVAAAEVLRGSDRYGGVGTRELAVFDLRRGGVTRTVPLGQGTTLRDLALAADGALLFTLDRPGIGEELLLAGAGSTPSASLATARSIGDLELTTTEARWTQDGARRRRDR